MRKQSNRFFLLMARKSIFKLYKPVQKDSKVYFKELEYFYTYYSSAIKVEKNLFKSKSNKPEYHESKLFCMFKFR
jgi:hypothetical protein